MGAVGLNVDSVNNKSGYSSTVDVSCQTPDGQAAPQSLEIASGPSNSPTVENATKPAGNKPKYTIGIVASYYTRKVYSSASEPVASTTANTGANNGRVSVGYDAFSPSENRVTHVHVE